MKKSKLLFLIFILFFSLSPFHIKAAGNGLDFSCSSKTVKSKFSCDTLKIVEKHLYDFDATNFNSVIKSYGGFENYARSVGGIFGQYYGKKMPHETERDFQTALEYVLGWMYMYGWEYFNGSGRATCQGKDCFYANGGFEGLYVYDPGVGVGVTGIGTDFDHIISGKNGGPGRMSSSCGELEIFTYNKLGISRDKQLDKVTRLKDLKIGDCVYYGEGGQKWNKLDEGTWRSERTHNTVVGEVYSDHVVVYDAGIHFPTYRNYKRKLYFKNTEAEDDAEVKKVMGYSSWGIRRWATFKPSSSVSGKGNNGKFFCEFCTKSEDDPLYKKEKQFYEKISIIKSIFGDRIDEVALAATVLHKYGDNYTFNVEYTEDFDSNVYAATWSNISASQSQNSSELFSGDGKKVLVSQEEKDMIEANEKVDLLTLAAIVMIDSNSGQYSDVCYKEGLAGDSLVGNTKEDDILSRFENGIFCGALEIIPTPLDFISNLFSGDGLLVSGISTKNRVVNTSRVCKHGYVGGLYQNAYKMKDGTKRDALKRSIAQDIIDFSNYYKKLYGTYEEKDNTCNVNISGSTGKYASWKQADSEWKSISLGGSSSVGNAGCLVTSISMQIARSGTKIGELPIGYSEFNPGAFVTSLNSNNGFAGGGNFAWSGFDQIAPNWGIGDFVKLNTSSNKELADAVSKELSSGYGSGNYQKFLVLQIKHSKSSQHWVAVNGVENDKVTIFDPGGKNGTTLDDNYTGWVVKGYRVMFAKDVPFGQTGTTSNNTCVGTSVVAGEKGVGNIKIPEEYGGGGYTVTTIDTINWAPGTGQGALAEEWKSKGAQYKDGIAVIDGRYLIACTTTFGKVGDKIDFFLDDGTKIPTIMMDEKSQEYVAWDHNPANKWGHDNGANVLEFEVAYSYYSKYGNPGNGYNSWYKEWSGKRVASATNLTNGGVSSSSSTSTPSVTAKDIAKVALDAAVTASPKKGIEMSSSNKRPTMKEAENYLKMHDAVWPKLVASDNFGTHSPYYASSAPAVLKVLHYSEADTSITKYKAADQGDYFESSSLWKRVDVDTSKTFDEVCEPGDVINQSISDSSEGLYPHTMIYLGNELVRTRFPKSDGNMWESAEGGHLLPGITNRKKEKVGDWKIYRYVPKDKINSSNDSKCVNGYASGGGYSGNLDFSCTSKKVKAQFSCETLKIVEQHLYELNANNFYDVINSYGGFENYARSLGGIFGQYYGKKMTGRTVTDFQIALEYVLGWEYMYGWTYHGSGIVFWKNGFYENYDKSKVQYYRDGAYFNDHEFDSVISGKHGINNMASDCGILEIFAYEKMGISRDKQLPKVSRLRDLKVGDGVYFFNHKVNKTDPNESDWGVGRHNVIVGEVYSDHLVFYDVGNSFPATRDYKRVVYFPNEAAGETDMDAIRKEYPYYDANVDWGMRRFYDFQQ